MLKLGSWLSIGSVLVNVYKIYSIVVGCSILEMSSQIGYYVIQNCIFANVFGPLI